MKNSPLTAEEIVRIQEVTMDLAINIDIQYQDSFYLSDFEKCVELFRD